MRLLHTSDWHLGQSLYGFERTYEHDRFLDWLLRTLIDEQVDALLVAGDIFDSAQPPLACQRRFFRFLADARQALPHLDIVVIAGNHDSAARLEAPVPILDPLRITVIGQTTRRDDGSFDLERMLVPLHRDGGVAAWCLAVPFLRPGDVPRVDDADDAYAAGTAKLYRDVLDLARSRRRPEQALVAMGHCHLLQGRVSEESERRIVIGGAEAMSSDMFDSDIAYVALGHLHLPQSVGQPTRRYSGSPLPLSFSEVEYPHQVVLVDLDGATVRELRDVRVPRPVQLLRVQANDGLESLERALLDLAVDERPEEEWPYLEVRVRLDGPEPSLRARVEQALADKPVRLARIDARSRGADERANAPQWSIDDLERLAPTEVFTRVYRQSFGAEPPPSLLAALAELEQAEADSGV